MFVVTPAQLVDLHDVVISWAQVSESENIQDAIIVGATIMPY
jgi:hypothetical protein